MQKASFRIWTQVTRSISRDNNHYATSASRNTRLGTFVINVPIYVYLITKVCWKEVRGFVIHKTSGQCSKIDPSLRYDASVRSLSSKKNYNLLFILMNFTFVDSTNYKLKNIYPPPPPPMQGKFLKMKP